MKRLLAAILLSSICIQPALTEETSGKSGLPGEYLYSFASSARGVGLGLAQVGLSGTADTLYSNPAGLADLWWQEAGVTYAPLFSGAQFMNLSYGYPVKTEKNEFVFGLNLVRLTSGDAEKTNELGEILGTFSDQQSALSIGAAKKLTPKLKAGAALKFVSQDIDTFSARSLGLDAGLQYGLSWRHIWALSIINAVPPKLGPDSFPVVAKAGYWHGFIEKKLYMSFDYTSAGSDSSKWYAGFEFLPKEWMALRAGANQKQYSLGFGLITRKVDFDYAFTYHSLNIFHAITLNIRYGFSPTEAEKDVERKLGELSSEKDKFLELNEKKQEELRQEGFKLKLQMRVTSMFIKARRYYDDGNLPGSKEALEEIIRLDRTNQEANALLGEINARLDENTAVRKMKEAKNYYDKGDYGQAGAIIEYVLSIRPGRQEAVVMSYLIKAQALIAKQQYKDAKNELIEVLKTDPNNIEASNLLKRLQTIIEVYEQK